MTRLIDFKPNLQCKLTRTLRQFALPKKKAKKGHLYSSDSLIFCANSRTHIGGIMDLDLIDAAHYEIGHCSSQEVAFLFCCCCSLCLLIQWNGGLFQLANMGFFTFSFIASESKFILWSLGLTLNSDFSKN